MLIWALKRGLLALCSPIESFCPTVECLFVCWLAVKSDSCVVLTFRSLVQKRFFLQNLWRKIESRDHDTYSRTSRSLQSSLGGIHLLLTPRNQRQPHHLSNPSRRDQSKAFFLFFFISFWLLGFLFLQRYQPGFPKLYGSAVVHTGASRGVDCVQGTHNFPRQQNLCSCGDSELPW